VTQPRQIQPGRYYLITRRCSQRQFLLRPGKATNAVFEFLLAESAKLFSIEIVAWLVMSNHYHAVVRDPLGQLPRFLERFHSFVARAMNAHWGRWETFWNASEQPCVTHLVTMDDVFDKVVYTLANPVSDHLVERVSDWPGSSNFRALAGTAKVVERPEHFFRAAGAVRRTAELATTPAVTDAESATAWAARVRAAVKLEEDRARRERVDTGKRVLGKVAILTASFTEMPHTNEPRRTLRPNVACKTPRLRVAALLALKAFRRAHAKARELFVHGARNVVFPAGTWAMRRLGVQCASCEAHPVAPS